MHGIIKQRYVLTNKRKLIFLWVSKELITEKNTLRNTHFPFCFVKFAFISSLNLKYMLTNSGIDTIYIHIHILLFMLTLKANKSLHLVYMQRINFITSYLRYILQINSKHIILGNLGITGHTK